MRTALIAMTLAGTAAGQNLGFTESFNAGLGGWGGGGTQTVISTGGVNGADDGFLEIARPSPSRFGANNSGPDFTGDLLAAGATGVSFWLNELAVDDGIEIHVGVGDNRSNFWLNINGFDADADTWTRYEVDFTDESQWVQIIGSGSFSSALANTDRLLFRHDLAPFGQAPDTIAGAIGVDQIRLVPTPSAFAVLAIVGVAGARRRR